MFRESVKVSGVPRAPASVFVSLTTRDVHVWLVSLDSLAKLEHGFAHILSEDERRRAGRFLFAQDRRRFILCRGVLRTILGGYLGKVPADLEFRYGPCGKPAIATGAGEHALHFNVSHAGETALYAVTLGRRVGIDLERVRSNVPTVDIAERFFSEREAITLRALDPAARVPAFFRAWTRKEAYLKATGRGLTLPPSGFEVSFLPGEPAALRAVPFDTREVSRWRLEELAIDDQHVGAIVVEGHDWSLQRWRWPPASLAGGGAHFSDPSIGFS